MTDYSELKTLAEGMKGWDNLTKCWPCDENGPDWQVGQVDEDGYRYPVLTIDTEQYDAESHASKLAQYYAAANPVTVLALIAENDRLKFEEKRSTMRLKELDLLFGRKLMIMRAAAIEAEHGAGHQIAMSWILCELSRTRQLPPSSAINARTYFEEAMKPIDAGMAEVFAFFHPQYASKSETPSQQKNDACCGCARSDHAGPCAEQSASKPAQQMPDKESICRAVVDICDRIPGSTAWNAAEFAYDEMVARLGGVKP